MTTAKASTKSAPPVTRTEEPPPLRRELSDRLPRPWLYPLAVFAAVWVLIMATWSATDAIFGWNRSWLSHILTKDGYYYLAIAQHGYRGDPHKGAFFPVFPLLIHLASYLTGGNYLIAGFVTLVASGAASAILVWALADRVCGRRIADRAVVLYCFFPGAMTFGILYSEPLSIALGAAALLALLDRQWLLTGLIGAVATAERPTLIVLMAVAGVAAIQAIWDRREWHALLAPALTPLGILLYFDFLGHRHHDYSYWFKIERTNWHQHIDWGVSTIRQVLWLEHFDRFHKPFAVLLTLMFIAGLAGIALMVAARLPLPLILFGVLTIALTFMSSVAGSRPRLVWVAFPIFIGAAAKLPRAIYWPVVAVSAAVLVVLTGDWVQLFGPIIAP